MATAATRNRKKLADMFDVSAAIVPHQYYPAEYVAKIGILHARAVHVLAEQVRATGKQIPAIPRPSWIPAATKEGKDRLRFRGVDILKWQDELAGVAPAPDPVASVATRSSAIRLPKRKLKQREGAAA